MQGQAASMYSVSTYRDSAGSKRAVIQDSTQEQI